MWIRFNNKELELLKSALSSSKGDRPAVQVELDLLARIEKQEIEDANDDRYRDQARSLYAHGSDDDIEVDDDAPFSRSDEGIWVGMWGYVRFPDPDDEEDEEDEENDAE